MGIKERLFVSPSRSPAGHFHLGRRRLLYHEVVCSAKAVGGNVGLLLARRPRAPDGCKLRTSGTWVINDGSIRPSIVDCPPPADATDDMADNLVRLLSAITDRILFPCVSRLITV